MTATPPPNATPRSAPSRSRVALDGRSVALDPRTNAVRPDLADIRLADRVFAPHYAAPVARVLTIAAPLRAERSGDAPPLAMLAAGTPFELLDILGDDAWGIASDRTLVGYVAAAALAEPENSR